MQGSKFFPLFLRHRDPMASMIKTSKTSLLICSSLVNIGYKVLSEDEIMRLESLGSSRLHNHWSRLQYQIDDWGFIQWSHTKSATMVSYRIGGPSPWVFFLWRQRRPHLVLNEFEQQPHHWDLREFGSDWSLAVSGDKILREFGSERDFVEGEERKRELEIERV